MPTPRKFWPAVVLTSGPAKLCNAGSGCGTNSPGPWVRRSGFSCFASDGLGDCGKSRNAGETSCFTSTLTSGWLWAHTRLGMQSTQNHTRGIDFRITQTSKFEFRTAKTTSPPTSAVAAPPSPEEEIWRVNEGAGRLVCLVEDLSLLVNKRTEEVSQRD